MVKVGWLWLVRSLAGLALAGTLARWLAGWLGAGWAAGQTLQALALWRWLVGSESQTSPGRDTTATLT
jgi:hypothetical protein